MSLLSSKRWILSFSPINLLLFFFLMILPPPRSTLFPYTTLFRSSRARCAKNPDLFCAPWRWPSRLGGDAGDAELGVRLAVAPDPVPALFLRAEVPELAVLAVRHHLGLDASAGNRGRAKLHLGSFADQQHLELDPGADVLGELLHLEEVALLHAILLPARPDHCVHLESPGFPAWNRPRWQGNPAAGRGKERAI